jgi:hypothetical protein
VRVQHASILEVDELVLAAAAHADDGQAADRPALRRRDAAAQGGMMDFEIGDAAADDMATQLDDRAFDFRKLGQAQFSALSRESSEARSHFVDTHPVLP